MNVTDIDDKIIIRSNERKIKFEELSRFFETEFLEDCKNLNIRLPTVITRVSEYVPEIVAYI
jgi:cysteinyl-tRNA synthetase